jgi:3'(2'), 5'-bisphosphate nucleotidase
MQSFTRKHGRLDEIQFDGSRVAIMRTIMDHNAIASLLLDAALCGGRALMACGCHTSVVVETKADLSPVSAADHASDLAVKQRLSELLPDVPVISEETAQANHHRRFLMLDPLDGTREYLAGGSEFAVALAYIEDGRPRAGVIVAPKLGLAWSGGRKALRHHLTVKCTLEGAAQAIHVEPSLPSQAIALVSRLHGDAASMRALAAFKPGSQRAASSAVKFALIAEGSAHIQIRLAPMMEWDAAAGDALIMAAGGIIAGLDGKALIYGQKGADFINPPFIAAATQDLFDAGLNAVQRAS